MNRRKMFGILTAPVAAANIPVQSEIRTDLKPYSAYCFGDIYVAWCNAFLRNRSTIDPGRWITPVVHWDAGSSGRWFAHADTDDPYVVELVDLNWTTDQSRQAFADACLNGEVPGMWWE